MSRKKPKPPVEINPFERGERETISFIGKGYRIGSYSQQATHKGARLLHISLLEAKDGWPTEAFAAIKPGETAAAIQVLCEDESVVYWVRPRLPRTTVQPV